MNEGVRVVRFDRPSVRNALTEQMRQDLVALVGESDDDDAVRVVILTGTDPSFCAGVDLKDLATSPPAGLPTNPAAALRGAKTPWIAAVNGACMTGGLEIALSCDFIVASDNAMFGDNHARYGMTPSWGLTAMLPEAVGVRWAKEISLTGRRVLAREALRIGLVNHVVAHKELMEFALQLASQITAMDVEAGAATLLLYDEVLRTRQDNGLHVEGVYKAAKKTNLTRVSQLWEGRPRA
jgi:enoyl-CoA hydratase